VNKHLEGYIPGRPVSVKWLSLRVC